MCAWFGHMRFTEEKRNGSGFQGLCSDAVEPQSWDSSGAQNVFLLYAGPSVKFA